MHLLDELHQSGRTIVLITHEAEVAEAAGRTMRIRDGEIRDGEILDGELVASGGVGR